MTTMLIIEGAALCMLIALNLTVYVLPPVVVRGRSLHVRGASGAALFNVILVAADEDHVLRHEFVHWEQMRRMTPLGVAVGLGWHYLRALLRGSSFAEAWKTCPFEQEANARMFADTPLPSHLKISLAGGSSEC